MESTKKLLNDTNTRKALCALSVAESLTDSIATEICEFVSLPGVNPSSFVFALRQCNAVILRNREWSFSRSFRLDLHNVAKDNEVDTSAIHQFLLNQLDKSRDDLPSYLYTLAGRAYHGAAVGLVTDSLAIYSDLAKGPPSGEQWLAGLLAEEQQEEKILPPDAIEPAFLRGMSLYNEREYTQAEIYLSKVADSKQYRPEIAIALHIKGILFARNNNLREALDLFDRSIRLSEQLRDNINLSMVLTSRSSVKRQLRDPDGALADLTHALSLNVKGTKSYILNSRASVKRDLNDIDGALEDLNRAIEVGDKTTYGMAQNTRSAIFRDIGDLDGAIMVIDELIELNKEKLEKNSDTESLKKRRNVLEKARVKIQNGKSIEEKKNLLCNFLLSVAKKYLSKYSDLFRAIILLRRIESMSPSPEFNVNLWNYLGRAYLKLNMFKEAVEKFEAAMQEEDPSSELLGSYAYALTNIGSPIEKTRPIFELSIQKNQNNSWAKSWFALALSSSGNYESAERYANEAVVLDKKNAIILFNLAQVLDQTGIPEKQEKSIAVAKESVKFSRSTFTAAKEFLINKNISF